MSTWKSDVGDFAGMVGDLLYDGGKIAIKICIVLGIGTLLVKGAAFVWERVSIHAQAQTAFVPPSPQYARFQLVSGDAFGIALDTKTGELCHTFDSRFETLTVPRGDVIVSRQTLKSIPLCLDLSQNEKATTDNLSQYHHPGLSQKNDKP